jgi:thiosulfate/3-mercaptopyruvate sulfurtransferase
MNRLGVCRWMLAMLLIAFASLNAVSAGCSSCGGGNSGDQLAWQENINKWAGEEIIATTASATQETAAPREGSFADVLVPASAVESTDIVLDVRAEGSDHVEGTIALPYTRFLTNEGAPNSVDEIAELLGGAGVNQDDAIILVGSDPSQAAYVYWALKYLGHQKVQILDTTAENWNPGQRTSQTLLPTTYTPTPNQELLASPDYLNSGNAQVVDARSMQEFGTGSIPGAVNTPSEAVIEDGRIKDQAALEKVFGFLNRQKSVVVYGESAQQCSPVWLALTLLDYDTRLYPEQS